MKKNLAGVIAIQPIALNKITKAIGSGILKNTSSKRTVITKQIATADPFENLKNVGKQHPSLKAILNKRRKLPSVVNNKPNDAGSLSEKPSSLTF